MKKTILWAILAMLLPLTQAWGSTYYYKMHLELTSGSPTGSGTVYAKCDDTDGGKHTTSVTDVNITHTIQRYDNSSVNTGSATAVPAYGYLFDGWYNDKAGTQLATWEKDQNHTASSPVSKTTNPIKPCYYGIAATKEKNATTKNFYAKFIQNPNKYQLTLEKPEGIVSYTVTGPTGFDGTGLAKGGSKTVYKDDTYSFSYAKEDDYGFFGWKVTSGEETKTYEADKLEIKFTADATITLDIRLNRIYTLTCLASEGGTYTANDTAVSGANVSVANNAEVTVTLANPSVNPGYEFCGWYKLYSNGAKEYYSYYNTVTITERDDLQIGADFRKLPENKVTFEASVAGSYTYAIGNEPAVAVDGADAVASHVGPCTISLQASAFDPTSSDANRVAKWYTKDDNGAKTYFAIGATASTTISTSCGVGVDFVMENVELQNAIALAQSNGGVATLTTNVCVAAGTTCTIPAGVTINLGGFTNYVDGTLVVNGAIAGDGVVSTCARVVKQSGNGLEPISSGGIKYWKTESSVQTGSVTGNYTASKTHVTMVNGYGETFYAILRNNNPEGFICKRDTTDGVLNTITGYKADYPTIGHSTKESGTLYNHNSATDVIVLFKDVTLTQSHFPSGMRYTQASGGVSTEDSSKAKWHMRIDCAGKSLTLNFNHSGSVAYYLNASSVSRVGDGDTGFMLQAATENYVNCASATQTLKNSAADAVPIFNVYDVKSLSVLFYSPLVMTTKGAGVNIRSGGPYSISSFSIPDNFHVFGGCYSSNEKPSSTLIEPDSQGSYQFYRHADGNWYLEPNQEVNVAIVDGLKKTTLAEAIEYVKAEAGRTLTVTMVRDFILDEPVEIPQGVSVRFELDGCKITAPNGFVRNAGTLEIGDKNGGLSSGVFCGEANVFENSGTIEVAYGKYEGGISLAAGSMFRTHHGIFPGAISVADGVSAKSVADLRGGYFNADVSGFLSDGFLQTSGYVGEFPYACIEEKSVSGYEKGYYIVAMDQESKALYCSSSRSRDAFSREDWFRRAELFSMYAPYLGYTIDCVVEFDRKVLGNTVSAYGKTVIGAKKNLTEDVDPNTSVRIVSGQIASKNYTQIPLSRFIHDADVNELTCAIASSSDDNDGTVCKVRLDLCTGAQKYDVSKLETVYTIGERRVVFGAYDSDPASKAMIRPETGAATFYSDLAGALAALPSSGNDTVMLCGDGEGTEVSGPCRIDLNGFQVGTLTHADWLELAESKSASGTVVYEFTACDCQLTVPVPAHTTLKSVTVNGETVEPDDDGKYAVTYGANVVISYTADVGYEEIESVTIDSMTGDQTSPVPTVTPKTYGITYNLDGGTNGDNPATYTIETADITLKAPTKNGCAFMGWYAEQGLQTKVEKILMGTTGAINLYAKWEEGLPVEVPKAVEQQGDTPAAQVDTIMLPKSYVKEKTAKDTELKTITDDTLAADGGVAEAQEVVQQKRNTGNKLTLVENYVLGLEPEEAESVPVVVPVQAAVSKLQDTGLTLDVGNIKVNNDAGAKVTYVLESSETSDFSGKKEVKTQVDNKVFENIELPTEGVKYYRVNISVGK